MVVPWVYDSSGKVIPSAEIEEPPPYFLLTGSDLPGVVDWRGVRYEHLRNGLFISEQASDVQVAELFQELAPSYEQDHVNVEFNHAVYAALVNLATSAISLPIRGVLDFGCGTGVGLAPLRRALPQARLLATDLSRAMVQFAAARGFIPVSMSTERIDLQDQSVDLVVGAFVLGLMRSPRAVTEIARVLTAGGAAAFNVYKPSADWDAKYRRWFEGSGLIIRVSNELEFAGGGISARMPVVVATKG
jgi:predicted TPR repeat methyltransferase